MMDCTARSVAPWMPVIRAPVSSAAFALWAASCFASEAATAKPLPALPECRAARLQGA
ncbi:MAG: hypothetical protein QJR07_02680 [Acetobacteraceae bacterium]|nr:hypothetical protein [Acetobacteraceae bacterium]MDI3305981.1 hypothetical protein [Acetobacteraceae bacterium]